MAGQRPAQAAIEHQHAEQHQTGDKVIPPGGKAEQHQYGVDLGKEKAPRNAPSSVPVPPSSEIPPSTQAAMAFISVPLPV